MENYYKTFRSKYGNILILWNEEENRPRIRRVCLNKAMIEELEDENKEKSCKAIDEVIGKIKDYLSGKAVSFDPDIIDFGKCSPFQKKGLLAAHGIPRGCISTYKKIAEQIKKGDCSQAVGNTLSKNPFPIIIPCHRVVASDGSIGSYQGGVKMKYELLKMEGVRLDSEQRVSLEKVFY